MQDDTMLPEDDRDRSLARRLGARLDKRLPLDADEELAEGADTSFYRALVAFKQQQEEPALPAEVSERVWTALEQRLSRDRPAQPRRGALRLVRSRAWLSMAAVVLVLVGLGWLLWPQATAPVLLAEAGAERVTYTTRDGSAVTLRPHSQLFALDEDETQVRLVGEGYFDVTKNETRTFSVEANDALVTVLGTRFNVSTWGDETLVYLDEGRVRFEHRPSRQAVVLAPGQRSRVTAEGTLLDPASGADEEYLDWLRGEMTFASRPLRLILAELGHHYGAAFDVPAALQDETFSGRILLTEEAQSIDDLAVVMGGRFVEANEHTYRFVSE